MPTSALVSLMGCSYSSSLWSFSSPTLILPALPPLLFLPLSLLRPLLFPHPPLLTRLPLLLTLLPPPPRPLLLPLLPPPFLLTFFLLFFFFLLLLFLFFFYLFFLLLFFLLSSSSSSSSSSPTSSRETERENLCDCIWKNFFPSNIS